MVSGAGMVLAVRRYALTVAAPLPGCPEGVRRGLVVRLQQGSQVGYGECAPLPGFSSETLAQAEQALVDCAQAMSRLLDGSRQQLQAIVASGLASVLGNYPSAVVFAVESAVEQLLDCDAGDGHQGYNPEWPAVDICRLLSGDNSDIIQQAGAITSGSVKIKVGRQALDRDIALVNALQRSLPASVGLRLDGNRCWTLEQACCFANQVSSDRVEYIEEPLQQPHSLADFTRSTGLAVALDESLQGCGTVADIPAGVSALVIKPTLCGGVYRSRSLAELGSRKGLDVVLSSSYESGLGLDFIAKMSRKLTTSCAQGLDTLGAYQRWLIQTPRLLPGNSLPLSGWHELESVWVSDEQQ